MAQPSTQAPVSLGPEHKARVVHRLRRVHREPGTDHKHPVNQAHYEESTRGERLADRVAAVIGSWAIIIGPRVLMGLWGYLNLWAIFIAPLGPYPLLLFNPLPSFQAPHPRPIPLPAR